MIGELISLLSHHIGTCVKAEVECTDDDVLPLKVLLHHGFPREDYDSSRIFV